MTEIAELKHEIMEIKALLKIFLPSGDVPLSEIAKKTHRTRQAVRDYITRHYEPDTDFYKKNGKIYISEEVAIELLKRR